MAFLVGCSSAWSERGKTSSFGLSCKSRILWKARPSRWVCMSGKGSVEGGRGGGGWGEREEQDVVLRVEEGVRSGQREEVGKWMGKMRTTAGLNRVLQSLVRVGWREEGERGVVDFLANGGWASKETVGLLVDLCQGDVNMVLQLLTRCNEYKPVTKAIYLHLLEIVRGREKASAVVDVIRKQFGVNQRSLKLLLGKCAEEGDVPAALEVIDEIVHHKFSLDDDMYLSLVRAVQKCGHNREDAVYQTVALLNERALLDTKLCLIAVNAHMRLKDSSKTVEIIVRSQPFLDNRLHSKLIDAMAMEQNVNAVESLVVELENAGITPNIEVLNSVMKAYATIGDLAGVRETYDRLRRISAAVRPNEKTYRILMEASRYDGDVSGCEAVLAAMRQNGISPNRVMYHILLKAYVEADDTEGFEESFFRMIRAGIEPDRSTYGILVDSYNKLGDPRKGEKCFKRMLRSRIRPDTIVCTSLLDLRIRDGRIDDALEIVEELMPRYRVQPDSTTYRMLVRALLQFGRRSDAIYIARLARRDGVDVTIPFRPTRRPPSPQP